MRRLLAHMVGDYVAQSAWQAHVKTRKDAEGVLAAVAHALTYTACFLPLTRHPLRLAVIGVTHGLLDHYRPLPRLILAKDRLLSPAGFRADPEVPFWLHIVIDNVVHVGINEAALDLWRRT